MLLADLPPELQRRRHLALLDREVPRQDGEALDLLEAGVGSVHLVDDALHELADVGVLRERDEVAVEAVLLGPACDLRPGSSVISAATYGPPVADDERLRDEP